VEVDERSDTVEVGHVVGHRPDVGEAAPAGSAVTVRVSLGAAPVKVPDVVGATWASAEQTLQGQGLIAVTPRPGPGPNDQVTGTDPVAGTEVAKLRQVTVFLTPAPTTTAAAPPPSLPG
jgi:serine/threonine-protein kinase